MRKLKDKGGMISIDEKACVPMGLPALSKTTRQVMDVRDPVLLADHTFSLGKKQSLVPSVICGVDFTTEVFIPLPTLITGFNSK